MYSVWISWNDKTPVEYSFRTEVEVSAFMFGVSAAATDTQWEQFDSLKEWEEKYNPLEEDPDID